MRRWIASESVSGMRSHQLHSLSYCVGSVKVACGSFTLQPTPVPTTLMPTPMPSTTTPPLVCGAPGDACSSLNDCCGEQRCINDVCGTCAPLATCAATCVRQTSTDANDCVVASCLCTSAPTTTSTTTSTSTSTSTGATPNPTPTSETTRGTTSLVTAHVPDGVASPAGLSGGIIALIVILVLLFLLLLVGAAYVLNKRRNNYEVHGVGAEGGSTAAPVDEMELDSESS
jgi:hypothetical protein